MQIVGTGLRELVCFLLSGYNYTGCCVTPSVVLGQVD